VVVPLIEQVNTPRLLVASIAQAPEQLLSDQPTRRLLNNWPRRFRILCASLGKLGPKCRHVRV